MFLVTLKEPNNLTTIYDNVVMLVRHPAVIQIRGFEYDGTPYNLLIEVDADYKIEIVEEI